jgi:hypothetical protein
MLPICLVLIKNSVWIITSSLQQIQELSFSVTPHRADFCYIHNKTDCSIKPVKEQSIDFIKAVIYTAQFYNK